MDSNTSREPLLMESDGESDGSIPDLNETNNTHSPFFTHKSLSVLIANIFLLIVSVVILVFAKIESSRQSSLCTEEHSFYCTLFCSLHWHFVCYTFSDCYQ